MKNLKSFLFLVTVMFFAFSTTINAQSKRGYSKAGYSKTSKTTKTPSRTNYSRAPRAANIANQKASQIIRAKTKRINNSSVNTVSFSKLRAGQNIIIANKQKFEIVKRSGYVKSLKRISRTGKISASNMLLDSNFNVSCTGDDECNEMFTFDCAGKPNNVCIGTEETNMTCWCW